MEDVIIPVPDYPGSDEYKSFQWHENFTDNSSKSCRFLDSVELQELTNYQDISEISCDCALTEPCGNNVEKVNEIQILHVDMNAHNSPKEYCFQNHRPGIIRVPVIYPKWWKDSWLTRLNNNSNKKCHNILTGSAEDMKINWRDASTVEKHLFLPMDDGNSRVDNETICFNVKDNLNHPDIKMLPTVIMSDRSTRCNILSDVNTYSCNENVNKLHTEHAYTSHQGLNNNQRNDFTNILSLFAERASLPGVKFIYMSLTRCARMIWCVLLLAMLGALTLHLYYLVDVYTSWPKSTQVSLGFDTLQFPAVTFCNVNPARASMLHLASTEIQKLMSATQPRNLVSKMKNASDHAKKRTKKNAPEISITNRATIIQKLLPGTSKSKQGHALNKRSQTSGMNLLPDSADTSGVGTGGGKEHVTSDYAASDWNQALRPEPLLANSEVTLSEQTETTHKSTQPAGMTETVTKSGLSAASGLTIMSHENTGNDAAPKGRNDAVWPVGNHREAIAFFDFGIEKNTTITPEKQFTPAEKIPSTNSYNTEIIFTTSNNMTKNSSATKNITKTVNSTSNNITKDIKITNNKSRKDVTISTNDGSANSYNITGESTTESSNTIKNEMDNITTKSNTNLQERREAMKFINNLDIQTDNLKTKIREELYGREGVTFSQPSVSSSIADQFVYLFSRENRATRMLMGHQIEDMLVDCSFNGGRCYPGNFTVRPSTTLGNCFTLDYDTMEVSRSGPKYGLTLVIFLEREEFLGGLVSGSGGHVVIHGKKTFPFPEEDSLAVAAGMEVNIAIRMMRIIRKDRPYGECDSGNDFFSRFGTIYTKRTCQHFCEQSLIVKMCGCYNSEQEEVQRFYNDTWLYTEKACETEQDLRCMLKVQKKYVDKNLECQCENPCSELVYTKSMSLRQWPSDEYADVIIEALCQSRSPEECETFRQSDKRRFAQNFMKVNIFYEDLNYENVTELASYEQTQFFSDIGGALGMWLGLSLMAAMELGHLLVCLLKTGIVLLYKKTYCFVMSSQS